MIIHSIALKNFLSFKKLNYTFEGDITAIVGGNYVGKSAILEAIAYAITGESRAEKEVELIHYGESVMEVTVVCVDDEGTKHKIVRGRTSDNVGHQSFDSLTKKAEVQSAIEKLLGISSDEFFLTSFFKQMDINAFMDMSPTEKKVQISKWLKNDHWLVMEKMVSSDLADAKCKSADIASKMVVYSSDLHDYDAIKAKLRDLELDRDLEERSLKKKQNRHKAFQNKANLIQKRIAKCHAELGKQAFYTNELKGKIQEYREAQEEYDKVKKEYRVVEAEVKKFEWKYGRRNVEGLKEKLVLARFNLKLDKEKLIEYSKTMKGECPILKIPCSKVAAKKNFRKELESRIILEEKEIESSERNLKRQGELDALLTRKKDLMAAKNRYYAIFDNKQVRNEYANRRASIQKYTQKIKSRMATHEGLLATNEKNINKIEDAMSIIRDNMKKIDEQYGEYKSKLAMADKNKLRLEELTAAKNKISNKIDDLNFVSYMFGKNGIPSLEIENSFSEIEESINTILSKLSKELSVVFNPDRELNEWEKSCHYCGFEFYKNYKKQTCEGCGLPRAKRRKDELKLNVIDNNTETKFNMLSGGAKTFVSIAVRIAILQLLRKKNGCKLKTLFFDEIDAPLEDKNIEKVRKVVNTVLLGQFGYKQVIWVSHNVNLKNSISDGILVKKKSGASEVIAWQP